MAIAKSGDKVRVHYTGKLTNGNIFDSSEGRDPLEFQLGSGQVIPGFDAGIEGMEVGTEKTVEIPVDQAYGPRRDELIIDVPSDQVPEGVNPKVGDMLSMTNQMGQQVPVKVIEVTPEKLVLDANPPLAGEDLIFEIKLVEIV